MAGHDGQLRRVVTGKPMRPAELLETGLDLPQRHEIRAEHRPRSAFLGRRAGGDRAVDGLLADRPRLSPAPQAHQRATERGQDRRPLGRWRVSRDELNGPPMLEERGLAVAAGPGEVAETLVEKTGQCRVGGVRCQVECSTREAMK